MATCEEVGGMAWVAAWLGFLKQRIWFFDDFPKLYDISPFFLLILSPH
jgi:hypothetical protein